MSRLRRQVDKQRSPVESADAAVINAWTVDSPLAELDPPCCRDFNVKTGKSPTLLGTHKDSGTMKSRDQKYCK